VYISIPVVLVALGVLLFLGIRRNAGRAAGSAAELRNVVGNWIDEAYPGAAVIEKALRYHAMCAVLSRRLTGAPGGDHHRQESGLLESVSAESQGEYEQLLRGLEGMDAPARERESARMIAELERASRAAG
jgi:hypothetical protein